MRVTVDEATIDVATDGKGEPIVLLHGFPVTREIWDDQADALSRDALVIRPDLRGMGRSSVVDGPYLMESLAGDVAAVLDVMGVERAAIVGHSLGGYVAMAFARMYTERVTRLALVCSRLQADSQTAARAREDLADEVERQGEIGPVLDAYLPKLFAPNSLRSNVDLVLGVRKIAQHIDPRGAAAMLRGMAARVDCTDIAADVPFPVLVVAGARDQVVPRDEAHAIQRAFAAATLEVLDESGHLPMVEQPEQLTRLLRAFLVGPGRG